MNFGLDGTKSEIYNLRGYSGVKKKAFENVIKCGVNKLTVVPRRYGINDTNMSELIDYLREQKGTFLFGHLLPLIPCWDSSDVKLEGTTTECVKIYSRRWPEISFVSTGMMKFDVLSRFFGKQTWVDSTQSEKRYNFL